MKNDNLTIPLRDGRQLGYAEYGDPDGQAVFYFHGLPGSRLEAGLLHEMAAANHIRLIGLDRPGMGLSSMDINRSILSWTDDVKAFADLAGIDTFSVMGHSGGAPFVAACAFKIPQRLNGAAVISGMAPFEIPEATASLSPGQRRINRFIRTMPWMAEVLLKIMSITIKKPHVVKKMIKQMPEADQLVFRDAESGKIIIDSIKESFRQGVAGASQEVRLTLKSWEFHLEDIRCPLYVWQGGCDKQAPVKHARIYAALIPQAQLKICEHEGHLSILKNHGEAILRSLCL